MSGKKADLMRLDELAVAIRSKNAGPCLLTFDIIFRSAPDFERARRAVPSLAAFVAERYGRSPDEIRLFLHPPSRAIKITLARDSISGAVGDRDVYGAQQHGPLLEFKL